MLEQSILGRESAFAGILQTPESSSKLSHRLCTAEVGNLSTLASTLMNMDNSTVVQVVEAT
jgi:hypothetical protein